MSKSNPPSHMLTERLRRLTLVFKALADEHRLKILYLLAENGSLSVGRLGAELKQSQPAVSHHLFQLRQAGLIDFRRDGKFNNYHIDRERMASLFREFAGKTDVLAFADLKVKLKFDD
jgi:DNA-binding transcriptional ArsR family regulator